MKLTVAHRIERVRKDVGRIPALADEAGRRALNAVTRGARDQAYAVMRQVFDRPTPYTLNSLVLQFSSVGGPLQSMVAVRGKGDVAGSGVPAESYLRAQIKGGTRRWKRSEVKLWRSKMLPRGWFAVPTSFAQRDLYGNMTRGQILEILAWFGTHSATTKHGKTQRNNTSDATKARRRLGTRSRAGYEWFMVPAQGAKRGGLPPGIYRRQMSGRRFVGPAAAARPVLLFVKAARYRQRFDFFGTLEGYAQAAMPVELQRAVERVRVARPLATVR